MKALVSGTLTINVLYSAEQIRLDWLGKSNHPQPEIALMPFFNELLYEARNKKFAVDMHFEKLEFFNSSTIAALIHCIRLLCEQKIKTTLSYDSNHKWQKVFFDALWFFDKGDGMFSILPSIPIPKMGR